MTLVVKIQKFSLFATVKRRARLANTGTATGTRLFALFSPGLPASTRASTELGELGNEVNRMVSTALGHKFHQHDKVLQVLKCQTVAVIRSCDCEHLSLEPVVPRCLRGLLFCLVLFTQAFDGCQEGHLILLLSGGNAKFGHLC